MVGALLQHLVFPDPAERSSFLLESVKHTCQYKSLSDIPKIIGDAFASSSRAGSPPEMKLRKVTVRDLSSETWNLEF